jgi:hypothetical protein
VLATTRRILDDRWMSFGSFSHPISIVAAGVVGVFVGCGEGPRDETTPFDDTGAGACPVGSETCPCTDGGGCDAGLECRSGLCVEADPGGPGPGSGMSADEDGQSQPEPEPAGHVSPSVS